MKMHSLFMEKEKKRTNFTHMMNKQPAKAVQNRIPLLDAIEFLTRHIQLLLLSSKRLAADH